MVIDTSAIVAILKNEPEGPGFVRLIAADEVRLLGGKSGRVHLRDREP